VPGRAGDRVGGERRGERERRLRRHRKSSGDKASEHVMLLRIIGLGSVQQGALKQRRELWMTLGL
jgi:hypothetical protein